MILTFDYMKRHTLIKMLCDSRVFMKFLLIPSLFSTSFSLFLLFLFSVFFFMDNYKICWGNQL